MANDQRKALAANERLALSARMAELLTGYQTSAALGAIARLGVADALAGGPLQPSEIATRLGLDAASLARVMTVLCAADVFAAYDGGRFGLTALGELLLSNVEGSARRGAAIGTAEWCWRAYGHLDDCIRTGEAGFRPAHGADFWEFLAAHPEEATAFDEVMSSSSRLRADAFAVHHDFSSIQRLCDVGGGQGTLLRTVLATHPHLHGVLVDLPAVVDRARAALEQAGLSERCEIVAGDFFKAVPSGSDAYLLSWILHDWDDEAACRILANCRRSLGNRGRLLLIEMVLPSPEGPQAPPIVESLARAMDLQMLVLTGGRERTRAEYHGLLAACGFELTRVLPLPETLWSVIEGVPA